MKFKKSVIVLSLLVSLGLLKVYAEDIRGGPTSGKSTSINADYGGVDVGTNSFYIGIATVPSENGPQGIGYRRFFASTTNVSGLYVQQRWLVYGVNFSTGQCGTGGGGYTGDFVSVQVSSSSATQARELMRIYNTVEVGSGPVCGGITTTRWPVRAYGNLFWGVNAVPGGGSAANGYNRADLLYYREE